MKGVGFFRELGDDGGPSLAESVGRCPEELRSLVADYLDAGSPYLAASTWVSDVLDPAKGVIGPLTYCTDGERVWPSALGHYVREYGVEVPLDLLELVRAGAMPPAFTEQELAELIRTDQGD